MTLPEVAILGTGMTDMSRRDLSPEAMAYQATHEALADAGIAPEELGLVIFANATAGRLNDQACVRGQSWLRKAGLNDVRRHQRRQLLRRGELRAAPGHHGGGILGPAGAGAGGREDVDGEPGRDDGRH